MSDEDLQNDPVIDQLEAEPIEAPNPIADFLKSVEDQDFVEAEKQFNDMVGDRLQDTLDQARTRIASAIYGDEELEAAVAEVEGEEIEDTEEEELDFEPEEEFDDEEDAAEDGVAGV